MTCWIDGRFVPAGEAMVPVLSNAVFRATSVFDVMAVVTTSDGPALVGVRPHLERLMGSMHAMYMTPTVGVDELVTIVSDVVLANPGCGIVRSVAYWGDVPNLVPADRTPSILVAAEPNGAPPPSSVSLRSVVAKIDASVLPAHIKVAAIYAAGIRAQIAATDAGFDGIVSRSAEGELAEGVSSSVLLVVDGRLLAPPLGDVLDSITRRLILDAAAFIGIEVEVRPVPWNLVEVAEAAFTSSTTAPMVPITRIDDICYSRDHPLTAELARVVGETLSGHHPLASRWLTAVR